MQNTPRNTYAKFIDFEERAAAFYLKLASRFSKNPKLSAFWLKMAIQEKQHAGLLQFCLLDKLFAPELPGTPEIQSLTNLFTILEKRAAAPRLSVKEAFRLFNDSASSEINTIYSYLTTSLHDSMYLLKRKIAITLPKDLDEVVAAAQEFGVSAQSYLPQKRRQAEKL